MRVKIQKISTGCEKEVGTAAFSQESGTFGVSVAEKGCHGRFGAGSVKPSSPARISALRSKERSAYAGNSGGTAVNTVPKHLLRDFLFFERKTQ